MVLHEEHCLQLLTPATLPHLHLDELLVIVLAEVVYQLHGPSLATVGVGASGWLLYIAPHVALQHFMPTQCTLEDCRPAHCGWYHAGGCEVYIHVEKQGI